MLRERLAQLKVGRGTAAVEHARAAARPAQLLAEEMERRDPVAAGDEQRLVAGRRRGERPPEGAEALREIPGGQRGQRARARADRLEEEAERPLDGIDGEDRERAAQGRLGGRAGLDHDELARAGRVRHLRMPDGEEDVRAVEGSTRDDHGVAIDGRRHPLAIITRGPAD